MTNRRSRVEMIVDILEAAKYGERRTKIMYAAYLSFPQMEHFMRYLIENDLIRQELDESYKTTERGRTLLNAWNTVAEILDMKRPKRIATAV